MPKDPLDNLHARTKESIRKASETILSLQPARNDSTAAPKKVVEVCLTCGTLAVHILKALGSVYPMCSNVADVLSAAIQMEQGREENDVRIVSVYIELADFICELKLVESPTGSIIEHFHQSVIRPMEDLLLRFSEFSGKYYGPGGTISRSRRLQNLFKNILSADNHRKNLNGFLNEIINLRRKLSSLLTVEIATTLNRNLQKIITSQTSIERSIGGYIDVTAREPTILDREELEEIFQRHLSNSALFRDENFSAVLQSTLNEWKEMDKQNKALFDLKFKFILDKFSAETRYLHDWLKEQAGEGPHNMIPDLDFQEIWLQTAGKRSSVERRQFIDGLSHYFALKMKKAETTGSPADSWTTDIICSVPYHAAICDAIDRDASGYISVSEIVAFLQRKPLALGWTNLQWLAYCAYGWHADNLFYSEQLSRLLVRVHRSGGYYYNCFQRFEKPLRMSQNGLHSLAGDLTPWAAKNMDEMILQRRAWVTQNIRNGLRKSSYRLDPSVVSPIAGGDQVEWWFFPVAFVLFSYHIDILSDSTNALPEHFLEDAQMSLKTLFNAYDARVVELKLIWRRLPGDITKAMKYYANGLFAHYFTAFNVSQVSEINKSNLKVKFVESDDMAPDNRLAREEEAKQFGVKDATPYAGYPRAHSGRPSEYHSRMAAIESPYDDMSLRNRARPPRYPLTMAVTSYANQLPAQSSYPPMHPFGAGVAPVYSSQPEQSSYPPGDAPDMSASPPYTSQSSTQSAPRDSVGARARYERKLVEYVPPTLVLEPLDGSFQRKYLRLSRPIRLGKEIIRGTSPQKDNGIFASEALSRVHAKVWEEDGKVYISDLGSTNGTYVNGQRLSPEGVESWPFELQSGDILHLGANTGTVWRVIARVQIYTMS